MRELEIGGAAHLVLAPGVALLHPEEAVVEAMFAGWRAQQQSRCLAAATISDRLRLVSRFWEFAGEYPWQWTPADLEAWTVSLLSREQPAAHSTVRAYQQAIAMFLDYIVDARYGWSSECEERFGCRPAQISHEWNTVAHRSEYEGRPGNRPFTRDELQAFFDFCDEQVDRAERLKRKGWLAAFRDATLFKVLYGWGLRRREGTRLDVCDFTANPAAPEFGRFGM